jgi:hypothetical protein
MKEVARWVKGMTSVMPSGVVPLIVEAAMN